MKFTLNWLRNYLDIGELSPNELADHLTMLGLEVDAVTPLYQDLANLQTGLIISVEKHPNADKLALCQVQIGETTRQIVCGATNVRQGLTVVVAIPGTLLPGDCKITKSKIRGIMSYGMICSEKELGFSNQHDGIMELPKGTMHGTSFIKELGLDDICIEVDLTPNRPDCTSIIGIAREIGGIIKKPLKLPIQNAHIQGKSDEFAVEIMDSNLCPRYAGRLIKNVRVGPSPWWLRKRLLGISLRPINNIVDITNFVMMEYGQPLHAFDFDTLAKKKIVVRSPSDKEPLFQTLDQKEYQLDPEMLMICDGEKPVAIAGVMGGQNSEVSEQSTIILLESAYFDPISIRRTARKLKLTTNSSYRFERGVDPEGTIRALNRAVELICELAGGDAPDSGIDLYPGKKDQPSLILSVARTNSLLGIELSREEISDLLESIDITCHSIDKDKLQVIPPPFRVDIDKEADLLEEVARLYGYNNIPTTMPAVHLSYPEQDSHRPIRLKIGKQLAAIGYFESINYSFTAKRYLQMMDISEDDERYKTVHLLNPQSEDQAIMRTLLLPGLLENVRKNFNVQKTTVKLFEIGKVFTPSNDETQAREDIRLAGVLSGNRNGDKISPHFKDDPVDIFDIKGVVEYIIEELSLAQLGGDNGIYFDYPRPGSAESFAEDGHELGLFSGSQQLGTLGKIRPEVAQRFAIKRDVYYFDLDLDSLCRLQAIDKKFSCLPVYPSTKRDIALIVNNNISAGELLATVLKSPDKFIESCAIFDVFQGDKIPQGCKSVALTITYRSQVKTLTEKNVQRAHSKIVRLLTDKFAGSFRNA